MAIETPATTVIPATPVPPSRQLPAGPKKRSFAWLWLLVIAGLAYAGWRYYQGSQQKQQTAATAQAKKMADRAIPIVATAAHSADLPVYLRGLGSAAAFNTVTVRSRVDGQLLAVHFTEGQFVQKGQLLAEIDPRAFQVQLEQAQGQMARDQAQLNDAKVNLGRYQALWNEKVIAKQQLDTQAAQVGQFEGVIESDQASINNAKLQLSYAHITAPLTGRIGLRLVDVGNMVHAADPNGMVVIAQLQPIAVLFTIPADNLPSVLNKLRAGVHLRVDAYDRDDRNLIASGNLLTVDNQIDATTGTSRLKAQFSNSDNALFPNQFVNARLLLDNKRHVTVVPAPAVQRGPQGTYVYLVTPKKTVTVRPITAGITEGNDVEVTDGLEPGDQVVTDGQDKLQEGTKVDLRDPNRPAGSGAPGGRGRGGQSGGHSGPGGRKPAA